jgi:tetratricopeptide (TPR) repeat protein
MQWSDIRSSPTVPQDIRLALQREIVAQRPHDAVRQAQLGEILLMLAKYGEAATAFERAEELGHSEFRHFADLASAYLVLGRPDLALHVCERGKQFIPDCGNLHHMHGLALRKLGRRAEAHEELLKAIASSCCAFEAAEALLMPLAPDPDGSRLLTLCGELPGAYANSTVVRGYRAIGLSRVGRSDEAKKLVDLDKHVAQFTFEPPAEFGGIEHFNALLAKEILANPDLRYTPNYRFYRTEQLNILGARVFPVLAKFLRAVIEAFISEFPRRGLDVILPPVPLQAFLSSAGNVVRDLERHSAHLHKFAYVSGVYHISVPPNDLADDRAGALVLGSCGDITRGYVPCWGARAVKPVPGVATVFPSHIFHSVAPTRDAQPRIAVPFDLQPAAAGTPA